MRFAIVTAKGQVENIVEAPADYRPPDDLIAIEAIGSVAPRWTWDGETFSPPESTQHVPDSVSDLQIRLALNVLGLRDAAEAVIAGGSQGLRDYWDRSLQIHRDHPFVDEAAIALNKSRQEIDELFRLAAAL